MSGVVIFGPPFGLGPVSRAVRTATLLAADGHDVTLATFADGVDHAMRSVADGNVPRGPGRVQVTDVGGRDPRRWPTGVPASPDVAISVMDERVLAGWHRQDHAPARLIFIDSLHWHRAPPVEHLRDTDVVLAQHFPGAGQAEASLRRRGINVCVHAPIAGSPHGAVDPAASMSTAPGPLLLYLGGLSSPPCRPTDYRPFVQAVCRAVTDVGRAVDLPVVLTGPACGDVGSSAQGPPLEQLGTSRFVHELTRSALVIAPPGIETTNEAILAGTPIVHLPPVNATQIEAASRFNDAGIPAVAPSWTTVAPQLRHSDSKARTLALQARLNDEHVQLGDDIRTQLTTIARRLSDPGEQQRVAATQRRLLPSGLPRFEDCLRDALAGAREHQCRRQRQSAS